LGLGAVEDDVGNFGRPRAVGDDVLVLLNVARNAERQTIWCAEFEAVAAAGNCRERRGIPQQLDAISLGLRVKLIDSPTIDGGEVDGKEARLALLPQRQK